MDDEDRLFGYIRPDPNGPAVPWDTVEDWYLYPPLSARPTDSFFCEACGTPWFRHLFFSSEGVQYLELHGGFTMGIEEDDEELVHCHLLRCPSCSPPCPRPRLINDRLMTVEEEREQAERRTRRQLRQLERGALWTRPRASRSLPH